MLMLWGQVTTSSSAFDIVCFDSLLKLNLLLECQHIINNKYVFSNDTLFIVSIILFLHSASIVVLASLFTLNLFLETQHLRNNKYFL